MIIVIAVVAVAVFWWFSQPPYPWVFKGAYAEYEGSTVVGLSPATVKLRLQVLDHNGTHAELLFHLETNVMGAIQEQDEVEWLPLDNPFSEFSVTCEKAIYIEGLGVRDCIVCEHHEKDVTTILYVDKQTLWPIQIVLVNDKQQLEIILKLKYTNIPGLEKP